MTVLLSASRLYAGYAGHRPVVHGIDLEVREGEVVALLGPNGAGKTTTILTLCGELSSLGGLVTLFGRSTHAPLHRRAREGMALITEERAVLMRMTVGENLRVSRCDRDEALELFPELEPHLDRRVELLSGGQQQMLAVARALARRTRILLADELSLGLGPIVVDRLLSAIRTAADGGMGVLLVEQNVYKAMDIADRVYVLQRGEVSLSGDSTSLRARFGEIHATYLSEDAVQVADSH